MSVASDMAESLFSFPRSEAMVCKELRSDSAMFDDINAIISVLVISFCKGYRHHPPIPWG